MIDDMQKEIDCQREQLSQKDEEMLENEERNTTITAAIGLKNSMKMSKELF